MVVLDTSVIIDHIRQPHGALTILQRAAKEGLDKNFAVSVITIQELYRGESTRSKGKEAIILATLAPLVILSYTYEVAKLAGEIIRDTTDPIQFADAAIASTAIFNSASLLTLNKKDFEKIKTRWSK